MAFLPWMQQPALPPGAEQKEQPPQPKKKSWWEEGIERMGETGGITMPWQPEHWEAQPAWTRHLGKAALGVGLTAGGAALGGAAIPSALAGASGFAPWLTGPALTAMAHPTALGMLGGLGGLMGSSVMAPGGVGVPPPPAPGLTPADLPPPPAVAPTAPPALPGAPGLPMPGEFEVGGEPVGEPQVVEVGGQQFWWNPTGGIYGTGGWELARAPSRQLTPEQQMAQTEAERQFTAEQAALQRAAQMEQLRTQYELEQQAMGTQAGLSREAQAAAAAQQMAQMYAADPYKYWGQLGMGTPGAVARLTGGEVAPGEQMQPGVPLSQPSQQWWGNLLPSEQQQIAGGLNWMGIDPRDWYAMQQRMIPGLGSRQMGPTWAR